MEWAAVVESVNFNIDEELHVVVDIVNNTEDCNNDKENKEDHEGGYNSHGGLPTRGSRGTNTNQNNMLQKLFYQWSS
jgi:hypothetical protein